MIEIVPIGTRIEQARKASMMSLRVLAERSGISHEWLRQYELGVKVPSSNHLIAIAKALGRPVDFFRSNGGVRVGRVHPISGVYMPETGRRRDAILYQVQDWLERYLVLEEITGNRVSFRYPDGYPCESMGLEDARDAGERLASYWGLTGGMSLIGALESRGIRVGEIAGCAGFFASAFLCDGEPLIAVSKGVVGDRRRMWVALSLGQIMLVPGGRDRERYACFAEGLLDSLTERPSRMEMLAMEAHNYQLATESRVRSLVGGDS